MAKKMARSGTIMTPEFRVSYPNIFTAVVNRMSKKEEYSLVALFKKGQDISILKNAVKKIAEEEWGTDQKKWPKKLRLPFRDQSEREKEGEDGNAYMPVGYEAGAIFINLKSKQRPGIVDSNRQAIIDETEIYAGCYARATLNAYAYDYEGNVGIAFGLNNVQKLRDGEPLSGKAKAEDDFEAVASSKDTEQANSLFE